MPTTVKTLLFTTITLLATIAGLAAAITTYLDGATAPATLRAAALGFSGSLTLLLGILTAYTLL